MSEEVTAETAEADENVSEATEAEDAEEQESDEDPAAGLKSALAKERVANKAHAKRIRELEREAADRGKSPDEKQLDEVRREAAAAANKRVVQAELRGVARDRGIDPKVAVKLANLDDVEIGDDGEIDTDALGAVVDDLLEEYPALAPSRFKGTADQGTRGKKPEVTKVDPNELIRAAFKKKD